MTDKLNEMWAALEAHKPRPSYAESWATMLKERTPESMREAWRNSPTSSVVRDAMSCAVYAVALVKEMAENTWRKEPWDVVNQHAQMAIDALKEVKP